MERMKKDTDSVKVIAQAMLDKKAADVVSLELGVLEGAITDHFVICNADSTTQVAAIADSVIEKMIEAGKGKPIRQQGLENGFWVILDWGDVVVHVFQTPYRAFYRIEDLWADAPSHHWEDADFVVAPKASRTRRKVTE